MRINKSNLWAEIKLSDAGTVPRRVQVLRVGSFNHPSYGKFDVTKATLSEMKANFDKRVRGIDTAFDYYHASDEDASAWVNTLDLAENGTELWADVDWTPKATKKLAERELRYFSPDFAFKWKDPESGKTYQNVLFGGGLTNRPFVKEMQPIVLDEKIKKEGMMKTVEELQTEITGLKAQILTLTEEKGKAVELQLAENGAAAKLKAQIAELQKQLAALEGDNKVMADKVKLAEETAAKTAKENEFNVMLSEGKVVAAQKDAFLANDMPAFIKLAQPVNLGAKGSSNSNGGAANEGDEADKIIKLAEEMEKKNPGMVRGESISLARKQFNEANKK